MLTVPECFQVGSDVSTLWTQVRVSQMTLLHMVSSEHYISFFSSLLPSPISSPCHLIAEKFIIATFFDKSAVWEIGRKRFRRNNKWMQCVDLAWFLVQTGQH